MKNHEGSEHIHDIFDDDDPDYKEELRREAEDAACYEIRDGWVHRNDLRVERAEY